MISLKKLTGLLLAVLLVAGAVIAYQNVNHDKINADGEGADKNIVSVNGKGVVRAEPNVAYINLAVKTENKDIKKAQNENAEKMAKVIKVIKELGIEDKHIQTADYSIDEDYDWINDKDVFRGYIIRNSIRIKVKDLSKAGEVLDKAVSAGANVANGISFDIENKDELYNEALKLAMNSAESKANAIMDTFGEKASKPYKVTESATYSTRYEPETVNAKMLNMAGDSADYGESIQGGSLTVIANVSVEYTY